MNDASPLKSDPAAVATATGFTACPHDCPSTCALEVELLSGNRIGRVRGDAANSYTAGVICAKVARYAERLNHPGRMLKPLVRAGAKGEGHWKEASFDAALDLIAERFLRAEAEFGSETVWPNYYAGTMGLVQRDGIHRLRHAKRYSNQFDSFCTNLAWSGFTMGAGALRGPDPREMAKSDCVVIWGTNAVSTQVNVMTHAIRARKERGARIVVVDIYDNPTMKQADVKVLVKPGTDAALACAMMHVLFRDGLADREYLNRFSDDPVGLEQHLQDRTPAWAEAICGVPAAEIEALARLVGTTKRTYFRLGYGFTRQRNGAVGMHAALSLAVVTGAFQYEGGGAFHSNSDIFRLDKSLIEGRKHFDPGLRWLDQSKIGRVLTGDADALNGGPPVTAMLIQNTNPANVAPEQRMVVEGLRRADLFVAVHEQFMTDTAQLADVVLPATMFLEHDDIYRGGGHQHIMIGPKLVDPPEGPRQNHDVIEALGARLGVSQMEGFGLTPREHIDRMLEKRGLGDFDSFRADKWVDLQPDFDAAHFLSGFGHRDGKYRFRPDWTATPAANKPPRRMGLQGPVDALPEFPDYVDLIETADADHPFRLATSPSRSFLNSSFAETPSSRAKEVRPELMIHPDDAGALGIGEGDRVRLGNKRGELAMHARLDSGQRRGVVIHEGLWPNSAFAGGEGINILTGADSCAPYGGAAFHDTKVWVEKA
jgi:anaerobic selenocysteine-containing dehydrogenase